MTKKNKKDLTETTVLTNAVDKRSFWERNEASDGILLTETIKKYALSIFRAILLFGMCFMIIQPILNKFSFSFMAEKDLYDTTIIVVPKHFSLSNWKIAIYLLDYKKTLFNTIWVSMLVSIIEVFVCRLRFLKIPVPIEEILVLLCSFNHRNSTTDNFNFLVPSLQVFPLLWKNVKPSWFNVAVSDDVSWMYGLKERSLYLYDKTVLPWIPIRA